MPRINPSPAGSSEPLVPPRSQALNRPASLSPTLPAAQPLAAPPAPQQTARPLPRPHAYPLDNDDTPLLPEQAAFQLPETFVTDVQRIAAKTGYVGLTPSAIQRAFLQGDGLFIDTSA